ncbi:hypothetical protein LXA43DRAFT_1067979 [Ganoderma leucocontextum]|nr:hypothetical protein LXA43DRAFT_1067979 [Ganoderma leucocontextum]
MSLNELVVWFIILAPFFCLLLSAFVAVAAYRVVVTWREQEASQEATQLPVLQNPAGRARRRTVRLSMAGGSGDQQDGQNTSRVPAVARARRVPLPRGVPRSLADAMVQTSFRLLGRSSARSMDEAGPSTHPTPSFNLPGPSVHRQATPGPSAPRLNATGPSASRADAPGPATSRSDIPGPSAPRAVVRDALPESVAIPSTPGSSSPSGLGRDTSAISSPIKRHVRKFTPRAKATQEIDDLPAEPSQVVTSFYQPDEVGDEPIEAPPDLTRDPELTLGDLFYYVKRDGTYKLWLWCIGHDGQPWWKPVYVGYQREDGRWLLITPHLKVPGWVTWDRFSRVFDVKALLRD